MASVDTINASSPASSSSSSSSSSSLPFTNIFNEGGNKFDVYLSFRGSDTRKNFTDHLFTAINQNGISTFRDDENLERGKSIASQLLIAIEESKSAVVVLSKNYASSTWCLAELAKIVECMEKKKLIVLPIFYHVDPRYVRDLAANSAGAFAAHEERFRDSTKVSLWRDALTKVANISGWVLNYGDPESQLIHEFIESLSNQILEDGSTNWNLPPRFDVTPYESDDADEMVQDYVADLPLMIEQLKGSSISLELPPRYGEYIDDAVDVMQEAHVVPDDVADVPQEAHVVEDHVADLPQEAHVVEDHVANLQQECAICVTNARGMAFLCGHTTCVECGERLDRCPICREPIIYRIRLFLE